MEGQTVNFTKNKPKKTSKPKRKSIKTVERVDFDPKARHEFVTGFHKRKVAAHKKKVEKAKARDHEEKLVNRREKRAKLAKLSGLVEEIDSVAAKNTDSPSVLQTTTEETKVTVTIQPFDPEDEDFE
ncbi:hypothetical protein HDV03_004168 [Kappamyces sp. JEL0829]|nr:hypothetical protein HDV03_004168 [Kappamyces sp. JEL0829]